jgi:hypothetical protein
VIPSQLLIVEVLRRPLEFTLAAAVGVVHEVGQKAASPLPERHLQRLQGHLGAQRARQRPADDHAAEHVDHEGGVAEA